MSQSITNPVLKQIEHALDKDGVWVSPQLKGQVTPAEEKQIQAAVAKESTPTYVVLVDLSYDDPLTQGDPSTLANTLRDDTGHDGQYVTMSRATDHTPQLGVDSFPEDYDVYQAARAAKLEQPSDLGAQTLDLLSIMRTGGYAARFNKAKAQHPAAYKTYYGYMEGTPSSSKSSHQGDDGSTGSLILGFATIFVVLALLATIVRAVVKKVTRPRPTAGAARSDASPTFTLPNAVLTTVRAAEDSQHEHQARREVLALGEAIDRTDLKATTAAAQASWQAALDQYDAANQILDRDHSPADAIGALVLARRGSAALDAASAGRPWTPAPGCYFNPLHPTPSGTVVWKDRSRSVDVPACDACATAIRAGREPDDILEFVSGATPRHYFNLDLGAWSATGYGALDTDLLGRLIDRRA